MKIIRLFGTNLTVNVKETLECSSECAYSQAKHYSNGNIVNFLPLICTVFQFSQ